MEKKNRYRKRDQDMERKKTKIEMEKKTDPERGIRTCKEKKRR